MAYSNAKMTVICQTVTEISANHVLYVLRLHVLSVLILDCKVLKKNKEYLKNETQNHILKWYSVFWKVTLLLYIRELYRNN